MREEFEASFTDYLDSVGGIERTGVSIRDYIKSARLLDEALPDHNVVVNIFFHKYYDPVIKGYVFPLVLWGDIIKDGICEQFGSYYERFVHYCDYHNIKSKEKETQLLQDIVYKYAKDFGIKVTKVAQLPQSYQRISIRHRDVFEVYELLDDMDFIFSAIDRHVTFNDMK